MIKNGRLKPNGITTPKTPNRSTRNSIPKLNTYSSQAVDPQIKQVFAKSAQDALNTKQKLMSFLNN